MTPLLWHYTTGFNLTAILRSRVLWRQAHLSQEELPGYEGWRRAVWFTKSETLYPPTARISVEMGRVLTLDEMIAHHGGIARIGVDPSTAPNTWEDYRTMSGLSRRTYKDLERNGRAFGDDPALWRMTFHDVYPQEWQAIERWDGSSWVSTMARAA